MGADYFEEHIDMDRADTMEDAFISLRQEAQYDYGHAGYTGTIAEKRSYTPLDTYWKGKELPSAEEARTLANLLTHEDNHHIPNDKWGPAAVLTTKTGFLFFGYASS